MGQLRYAPDKIGTRELVAFEYVSLENYWHYQYVKLFSFKASFRPENHLTLSNLLKKKMENLVFQ